MLNRPDVCGSFSITEDEDEAPYAPTAFVYNNTETLNEIEARDRESQR